MNILLVEPSYRSKFPPLGLMRLSTYHKSLGDRVVFVRGANEWAQVRSWDRIYISSLFTWELPRTAETIEYYSSSVSLQKNILVGGVGVTLLPSYIKERFDCTIVQGPLDMAGKLDHSSPAIADLVPDYSILERVDYDYTPVNSYFVRLTKGCIRKCNFCAVPLLETEFGKMSNLRTQIGDAIEYHGEKQHLVVLDNNILGIDGIENIFKEIRELGFGAGAKRKGRIRSVDFNQGLDARLINGNPGLAKLLATICVSPIRLAFDFIGVRKAYEQAIRLLVNEGFNKFTNYMLFNFHDSPRDLYDRLWVNANLNRELGIKITGFPMRFIPMDDVNRNYVSPGWQWRYLRGIQCILLATHGLVSPNPEFISHAFGESYDKFLEILSMPDRYIIYREHYNLNGAQDWQRLYHRFDPDQKNQLINLLFELKSAPKERSKRISLLKRPFSKMIEHYYPGGKTAPRTPNDDLLAQQGVSVGYDNDPL